MRIPIVAGPRALLLLLLICLPGGCFAGESAPAQVAGGTLPVFPGAEGFGSQTRAGRAGRIYRVTSLTAANEPGSLLACLEARDQPQCAEADCARVCIFETSGTIVLDGGLWVRKPFLTVAGQTAPSPGITLRGAPLRIATHDVLVQHLRIRVGDDPPRSGSPWPKTRDGLGITSIPQHGNPEVHSVVVDHVSVSWAVDENIELYGPEVHDVTISHSISSEALARSIHQKTVDSDGDGKPDHHGRGHSMGLLASHAPKRVALIGNLFAHNDARNPQFGGGSVFFANNLVYGWGTQAGAITGSAGFGPTLATIVGNVYVAGPGSILRSGAYKAPISLGCRLEAGSAVHVGNDNLLISNGLPRPPAFYYDRKCTYDKCRNKAGCPVLTDRPPLWPAGMELRPTPQVEQAALASAGARPADRDAVDLRIADDVRRRSCAQASRGRGRCIIDSQKQVGGWPHQARRRVEHQLPANPSDDDDGDGYTNLEEWLHELSRQVEGRS